jgi:hypothetical protein
LPEEPKSTVSLAAGRVPPEDAPPDEELAELASELASELDEEAADDELSAELLDAADELLEPDEFDPELQAAARVSRATPPAARAQWRVRCRGRVVVIGDLSLFGDRTGEPLVRGRAGQVRNGCGGAVRWTRAAPAPG